MKLSEILEHLNHLDSMCEDDPVLIFIDTEYDHEIILNTMKIQGTVNTCIEQGEIRAYPSWEHTIIVEFSEK